MNVEVKEFSTFVEDHIAPQHAETPRQKKAYVCYVNLFSTQLNLCWSFVTFWKAKRQQVVSHNEKAASPHYQSQVSNCYILNIGLKVSLFLAEPTTTTIIILCNNSFHFSWHVWRTEPSGWGKQQEALCPCEIRRFSHNWEGYLRDCQAKYSQHHHKSNTTSNPWKWATRKWLWVHSNSWSRFFWTLSSSWVWSQPRRSGGWWWQHSLEERAGTDQKQCNHTTSDGAECIGETVRVTSRWRITVPPR